MKYLQPIIISFLLLIVTSSVYAQDDYVIIANKSVPTDELNKKNSQRIFFGFITQWEDNQKIAPCYVNVESFWQSQLNTSYDRFNMFWTKKVFSGNGVAPKEFKNDEDLIEFVARTPGAVGVISVESVNLISGNCKQLNHKVL